MENGSKKPKPKCRYYACIYSGTTHHGPHGLSVRCCGGTANLGTGHFKTVSKARNESRQGAVMELIKKRWDGVKLDKSQSEKKLNKRDSKRAEQELAKLLLKKKH